MQRSPWTVLITANGRAFCSGADVRQRQLRTREELTCLTDEALQQFQPQPLHAILASLADRQLAAAGQARNAAKPEDRRRLARESWARLLGNVEPPREVKIRAGSPPLDRVGELTIRRELLDVEPGITIPLMVIFPNQGNVRERRSLVVHFAPDGISGMLRRNIDQIAAALQAGRAVAFVEVRGTGASSPGADHGQQGAMTAHSATELMLVRTLLAGQLRDLRAAWQHLAAIPKIDRTKLSICGDSPAEPLPPAAPFSYPRRIDNRPSECLPQASLLALLCALFEDDVASVEATGGLVTFRSVLDAPFVQVPHACIVPGVLREGDLVDLTAALVPQEVTLRGLVDGSGRAVSPAAASQAYAAAIRAYSSAALGHKLNFVER